MWLRLIKKPSILALIFLIGFTVDRYNRWTEFSKGNNPFVDDVDQFYSYLPAIFIHHDLTFSFPNNYWTVKAPNGNNIARTTYGMALLYSPFFAIGHIAADITNEPKDGYSMPYKRAVHLGTIFYVFLGLIFCRLNLLMFFSELVTAIALIAILLGTNLFYYTYGWGEMSHSYLFFIISLAIYNCIKWFTTGQSIKLYIFFLLSGVAVLIRPTDIVILLFPLLYKVSSWSMFIDRLQLIRDKIRNILIGIVLFFLPLLFQLLYWKIYSGSWFVFTYGVGERFYFGDPQIINFLFSYRKGWLVYTPIMIFMFLGLMVCLKKYKDLFFFSLIYLTINIYLLSSWWDWGFGGSFGCRAIIQHYALLVFPLAAFIAFIFSLAKHNKWLSYLNKAVFLVVIFLLIWLNYKQSWKYKYGLIHFYGMTKEAYWYTFNKEKLSDEELKIYNSYIKSPDFNSMLKGKRD